MLFYVNVSVYDDDDDDDDDDDPMMMMIDDDDDDAVTGRWMMRGWSVYKQSNRLDMKPPDRTGVPDETTRCPLES